MKYYIVKVKRSASKIDVYYRTEEELIKGIAKNSKSLYPSAEVRIIDGKFEEPFPDATNKK